MRRKPSVFASPCLVLKKEPAIASSLDPVHTALVTGLQSLGIVHAEVVKLLGEEVTAAVQEARLKGEKLVTEAQAKAATQVAEAEKTALEKVLRLAYVCTVLARVHTAKPAAPAEPKAALSPVSTASTPATNAAATTTKAEKNSADSTSAPATAAALITYNTR